MNECSFFFEKGDGIMLFEKLRIISSEDSDRIAYRYVDQKVSYGELQKRIDAFSASLLQKGFKKGDHLAVILANSPEFIISVYGAMQIGVVVVPMNPIYTKDEMAYILRDSDAMGCVAYDQHAPLFAAMDAKLPNMKHYFLLTTREEKADFPSIREKVTPYEPLIVHKTAFSIDDSITEEDVAVILYTSGTTGQPKGAMLTHRNIYSNARDISDYLQIGHGDKFVCVLPMFHVFCFTIAVNTPLISGGTILIFGKFSPKEVIEVVKEEKATVFAGVPTMFSFLYQYPNSTPQDLQSLKLCISGGAALPVALLENFEKKFNVEVYEGYGLSEASPVCTFNPIDRSRKPGSIGTQITNVECRIFDELGNALPPHEVGELVVKGPNVMKGYYKLEEETKQTIKDGWLYTGDVAYQDEEGYFFIVDRKKDMIVVGGFNVYPREVEEVLYKHKSVVEAAVVGIPDLDYGEAIRAYVVPKEASLSKEELIAYCKEHLAKYKIPHEIEFLKELPKNTTGKILRRSLKEEAMKQTRLSTSES